MRRLCFPVGGSCSASRRPDRLIVARNLGWQVGAFVAMVVSAAALARSPDHRPVFCGIHYDGSGDPVMVSSLGELPSRLRELVARRVKDRLGAEFASELRFETGQITSRVIASASSPHGDRTKREVYNLIYRFRLSVAQDVQACLEVDTHGVIVEELSLPAWARGAPLPRITTLAEAEDVAREHRMVGPNVGAEIRYFRDTESLEWLFSKTTHEHGPFLRGKTLHVPLQDPGTVHWEKWSAIR